MNYLIRSLLLLIMFFGMSFCSDGERKGLVLGIGISPGLSIWHNQISGFENNSSLKDIVINEDHGYHTDLSIITNYKIGYAPTNTFQFYWSSKQNWFNPYNDYFLLSGISGIGLSKYLNETYPSRFIDFSIGSSSWIFFNNKAAFEQRSGFGIGATLGFGYEINQHINFNLIFAYSITRKPSIFPGSIIDPITRMPIDVGDTTNSNEDMCGGYHHLFWSCVSFNLHKY